MISFRRCGIIAVSALMMLTPVSCFKHEKVKDDSEIETELEEKYGRDFELISHDKSSKNIEELCFRDDNGVEFTVRCVRETNIAADSKIEYSDDYISCYLKDHGEEYLSGIDSAGIVTELNDYGLLTFYVDSYSELDALYEEVKKLDPPLIYPEDNYIKSGVLGINSSSCNDSVGVVGSEDKEKDTRQTYVNFVRNGKIKEDLPEEVLREYPAKSLRIFINGREFNSKEYGGAKAYVQEYTGEVCIEFKGVYANSQNYIQEYTDLEKFINAVVGNDVKKVYDPNVVYENKDGSQVLKKKAENYFEWTGGKFDLYDDEAVDINSSVLRLYEKDIKRIFGAEWSVDTVFTGRLTIEK